MGGGGGGGGGGRTSASSFYSYTSGKRGGGGGGRGGGEGGKHLEGVDEDTGLLGEGGRGRGVGTGRGGGRPWWRSGKVVWTMVTALVLCTGLLLVSRNYGWRKVEHGLIKVVRGMHRIEKVE